MHINLSWKRVDNHLIFYSPKVTDVGYFDITSTEDNCSFMFFFLNLIIRIWFKLSQTKMMFQLALYFTPPHLIQRITLFVVA